MNKCQKNTKVEILELIKKKLGNVKGLSGKKKEDLCEILVKKKKTPKCLDNKKLEIIELIKKKLGNVKGLSGKNKSDLCDILKTRKKKTSEKKTSAKGKAKGGCMENKKDEILQLIKKKFGEVKGLSGKNKEALCEILSKTTAEMKKSAKSSKKGGVVMVKKKPSKSDEKDKKKKPSKSDEKDEKKKPSKSDEKDKKKKPSKSDEKDEKKKPSKSDGKKEEAKEEKEDVIGEECDKACKMATNMQCIISSNKKLMKHQITVIQHVLNNRGLLVYHGTGTGKTLTAITAFQCLIESGQVKGAVIITPISTIKRFLVEAKEYYSATAEGKKLFAKYFPQNEKVKFGETPVSILGQAKFARIKNMKAFIKNKLLVIDEAHLLKTKISPSHGKEAVAVLEASKYAAKVIAMTATPIMNREEEIVNLMDMIYGPNQFTIDGDKVTQDVYKSRILAPYEQGNTDMFDKYFKCKVSINDADDKKLSERFPKVIINEQILIMSKAEYEEYWKAEIGQWEKSSTAIDINKNLSMFYNGIRRKVNEHKGQAGRKIDWIIDHIISTTAKMKGEENRSMIYTTWEKLGINLFVKKLNEKKMNFSLITGKTKGKERQRQIDDYNTGKNPIIILSSAGKQGIDLKGTRNEYITDVSWNQAEIDQIIGRGARNGSHLHLPPDQRYVTVWKLYLDKPEGWKKHPRKHGGYTEHKSIDTYLREMDKKKGELCDAFKEKLIPLCIEKNEDCIREKKRGEQKKELKKKIIEILNE
jgi:superfamily II DNA or RNA helicase